MLGFWCSLYQESTVVLQMTDNIIIFLTPSQGKSNLLWLLAETPLRLEPLLIYGMQMQSILRCEKVIGRPCTLDDLYQLLLSLCSIVEDFKTCNSVTNYKVLYFTSYISTLLKEG